METTGSMPPQSLGQLPPGSLGALFNDALRFWEPRRVIYNLILFLVSVAWVVFSWPHFRPAFRWSTLPPLLFLAFVANVCYCAAYVIDLPLQGSSLATEWKHRRWVLWLAGLLFAILLTNYWIADEIYPFVG
jgi:hypothetical protein